MAIKKGNRGRGASSLTECTLRKDKLCLPPKIQRSMSTMRRKSYAKSVVAVAMAATVALSATACGSKSTADTADTSTSQSEAASSEAETPTATTAPTATPALSLIHI